MVHEPAEQLSGATQLRLDALRRQVDSVERHLAATDAERLQIVGSCKRELSDALARVAVDVRGTAGFPPAVWEDVRPAADALERLLATRVRGSTLDAERTRVDEAIAAFNAELVSALARAGRRFDGRTLRALRRFQQARDALDDELRIAAGCRRLTSASNGRALAECKRAFGERLEALKGQLEGCRVKLAVQRERSAAQWRELDAQLRGEVEAVGKVFEELLPPVANGDAAANDQSVARAGKTRTCVRD